MIKKYCLVILLILGLFFIYFLLGDNKNYTKTTEKDGLKITISSPKKVYKSNEKIIVNVKMTNTSLFTIYKSLGRYSNDRVSCDSFVDIQTQSHTNDFNLRVKDKKNGYGKCFGSKFILFPGQSISAKLEIIPLKEKLNKIEIFNDFEVLRDYDFYENETPFKIELERKGDDK